MEIEVGTYKNAQVIALSGDVDMYSSPTLRKTLMQLIGKKATPLLVDFKDVAYIDSSGIATFVEGLKGMRSYGGSFRFVAVPERVMEIFNFSKLDKIFEIYRTIDDALKS